MRFAGMALVGALLAANTASAADREFKDVVREISDEFHTKPMHIPMMGLVNGFMKVAHPVGAKHVEIAIFQDIDWGEGSERSPVASVKHALGEWSPFVQSRNDRGETVLLYMRENGKDVNVLVATLQRDQMVVTEIRIDTKQLVKFLNSPDVMAWKWSDLGHDNNE